jgi:hypothetical protein
VFGGIPSIKEPTCPSISNVLVAALEGCATAVVDIERLSNIKKMAKTRQHKRTFAIRHYFYSAY